MGRNQIGLMVKLVDVCAVIFPSAGCRYVSKAAVNTQADYDYDRPVMKTQVPGPRSKVTQTYSVQNLHFAYSHTQTHFEPTSLTVTPLFPDIIRS